MSTKREKTRPATLALPEQPKTPFSLSQSGTFTEGDISINKSGLVIGGKPDSPGVESRASRPASAKTVFDYAAKGTVESHQIAAYSEGAFDLSLEDLKPVRVLGQGSSGVVQLVEHRRKGSMLALKVIQMGVEERVRKQILSELRILHQSYCPYIVACYGAFFTEGAISIALEFMDGGSLADIYKGVGSIPENYLAKICQQVLRGLQYLHKDIYTIHRDIKPSNLLLNSAGDVKISDFGVSGQLANSMSKCASWVGTVTYMSPERISGKPYSYDSDVWSFGLSILECAIGRFPYPPPELEDEDAHNMGFWDLLDYIVEKPAPRAPDDKFSPEFIAFIDACLQKEAQDRPSSSELLEHPFMKKYDLDSISVVNLIPPRSDQ
eukprot:jgi/Mesvir1/14570/Mv05250-RA.1